MVLNGLLTLSLCDAVTVERNREYRVYSSTRVLVQWALCVLWRGTIVGIGGALRAASMYYVHSFLCGGGSSGRSNDGGGQRQKWRQGGAVIV